jgi:hypothetical protein
MSSHKKDHHALDGVLARAAIDPAFRAELLIDPRGTIRRGFNIEIPPNIRVKFIERDADVDALIVLPDLRSTTGELSDSALDVVSGGVEYDAGGDIDAYDYTWSDEDIAESGG